MDVNCGYIYRYSKISTGHFLGRTKLISCIWSSGRADQGCVTCVNSLLQCLHGVVHTRRKYAMKMP